jgi:hypothetical protein
MRLGRLEIYWGPRYRKNQQAMMEVVNSVKLKIKLRLIHPRMSIFDFGDGIVSMPTPDPSGNGWLTSSSVYLCIDNGGREEITRSKPIQIQYWEKAREIEANILGAAKKFAAEEHGA